MTEVENLKNRLRDIDRRLAEIEATLPRLPARSHELYEVQSEQGELTALRGDADRRLRELTTPPTAGQIEAEKKREAYVNAREVELRDICLHQAEIFAKQGDHRNARIYRVEALRAREEAEREVS